MRAIALFILGFITVQAAIAETGKGAFSFLAARVGEYPDGSTADKEGRISQTRSPIWLEPSLQVALIELLGRPRFDELLNQFHVVSLIEVQENWIHTSAMRPHDPDSRAEVYVNLDTDQVGVCWSSDRTSKTEQRWFFTDARPRDADLPNPAAITRQDGCAPDSSRPFQLLSEYAGVRFIEPATNKDANVSSSRWYQYVYPTGACEPSGSPADLLTSLQKMGEAPWTEDVTDPSTGEVIQTTIYRASRTTAMALSVNTYFRRIELCANFVQEQRNSLDRYR